MRITGIIILIALLAGCEETFFESRNDDPEYIFETFWKELDRHYSFFEYSKLDWDSVHNAYKPRVNKHTSETELFQVLNKVTDLLNDAHTNVFTPKGVAGNVHYFDKFPVNQIEKYRAYFEYYITQNKIFDYGQLKGSNLGYIKIKTFEGENKDFTYIDTILRGMETLKGIIIDVRSNRGGLVSNSEIIASRFADKVRHTCKYRLRNGPNHNDFSDWIDYTISPTQKGVRFTKPVIVLTNRYSYSATEWFVLFADVIPTITIVGDTTGGGSAIPVMRELPNGWLLRTSNTQTMLPSGRDFQVLGLYPDIAVWISKADALLNKDTILEKAVALLLNL
jgi:C-terminal processing protease CtpA/Prc